MKLAKSIKKDFKPTQDELCRAFVDGGRWGVGLGGEGVGQKTPSSKHSLIINAFLVTMVSYVT